MSSTTIREWGSPLGLPFYSPRLSGLLRGSLVRPRSVETWRGDSFLVMGH